MVVIAKGTDVLFIKYIDVGGRQFDEAVARHLEMSKSEAALLRRHNGDRRPTNKTLRSPAPSPRRRGQSSSGWPAN